MQLLTIDFFICGHSKLMIIKNHILPLTQSSDFQTTVSYTIIIGPVNAFLSFPLIRLLRLIS